VRGFDLAGEFSFTSVRQEIDVPEGATSQRMTQIQLGLGLLYRFDFGNLSVSAGPRVAYLYLDRNPSLVEAQSVSTVSAGGALGVAWRFSQRVSLGVEGRGNYVPLPLEDVGRDQWMVEVLAAASYHF